MDRTVDSAAAQQRAVGGIDDGIDIERGDVADYKLDMSLVDFDCEERRGFHFPRHGRAKAQLRAEDPAISIR
jgi:hypothetical protein